MALSFRCTSCRTRLSVPESYAGKHVTCGGCDLRVYAPSKPLTLKDVAEKTVTVAAYSQGVLATLKRLYRNHLTFPWTLPDPELRRCVACGREEVRQPEPCGCGGVTVGLRLAPVFSGRDGKLQTATRRYAKIRKFVARLLISAALIGLLIPAYLYSAKNGLVASLLLPLYLGVYGALLLGVLALIRAYTAAKVAPKLAGFEQISLEEVKAVNGVYDGFILPFFSRNAIHDRKNLNLDAGEAAMLMRLLNEEKQRQPRNLPVFFEACALYRDYQRFTRELHFLRDSQGADDLIEAFVLYQTGGGGETGNLIFLQQALLNDGELLSLGAIRERMVAAEKEQEYLNYKAHLESCRQGGDRKISIEEVDAIDFFNFELLVGMIYESLGYRFEETPKSGDQGADGIISRGGERTVIQAKLYSKPVSNSAVQEAVAAKAHWKCQNAMVVTNQQFTASAQALAKSNNVALVDRAALCELIAKFNERAKDYARLEVLMTPRKSQEVEAPLIATVQLEGGE